MNIIGRHHQFEELEHFCGKNKAAFIALYGRRRVGKTFLVREFFESRATTKMTVTGEKGAPMRVQLANFQAALETSFYSGSRLSPIKTWRGAFEQLIAAIRLKNAASTQSTDEILIFLDELPWLATARSNLCGALDYAWNTALSMISAVRLVICGSAASWMIENIVRNTGGLHNRLTGQINLHPFLFDEFQLYCSALGHKFSFQELLEIYMCLGGVPYYLDYLRGDLSAAQNIDALLFQNNCGLKNEYPALLAALFRNARIHAAVIAALGTHPEGLLREEVARQAKTAPNGGFTKVLEELQAAGFVTGFIQYGLREHGTVYRLTDEFLSFYMHWLKRHQVGRLEQETWLSQRDTPAFYAWAGRAFESVMLKHHHGIKKALGFGDVSSVVAPWRLRGAGPTKGAQVDLVLDRADGVITLCEMKHTKDPLVISSALLAELQMKEEVFRKHTETKKRIQWAIVSNHPGIVPKKLPVRLVSAEEVLCG